MLAAALELPYRERDRLAQILWASLHPPYDENEDIHAIARQRSRERADDPSIGIPHDEVISSLKRRFCETSDADSEV